jgi:hypothetical protein
MRKGKVRKKKTRWLAVKPEVAWTSFESAIISPEEITKQVRDFNLAATDILADAYFLNSRYQVALTEKRNSDGTLVLTHLSIRRLDRGAIFDWRDLQRIKNELLGEEVEAIQIFPAESRLVDQANQFHLWALPPGEKLGIGFNERSVSEGSIGSSKQRPFSDNNKPRNLRKVGSE